MSNPLPQGEDSPLAPPAAGSAPGPTGRLTALDVQRQQFSRRRIGGLDEEEVYRFLGLVARELEGTVVENRRLKESMLRSQKQLQDYIELERTLKQTLATAQRTTTESRGHAQKEAELILKQAELDAERIVDEARSEARQLLDEVRELKKAKRQLRIELKTLIDGYADMLKDPEPEKKV